VLPHPDNDQSTVAAVVAVMTAKTTGAPAGGAAGARFSGRGRGLSAGSDGRFDHAVMTAPEARDRRAGHARRVDGRTEMRRSDI